MGNVTSIEWMCAKLTLRIAGCEVQCTHGQFFSTKAAIPSEDVLDWDRLERTDASSRWGKTLWESMMPMMMLRMSLMIIQKRLRILSMPVPQQE